MLGGLPVFLKFLLITSMLIRQAGVGAALIRRPARLLLFLERSDQVRLRLGWIAASGGYTALNGPLARSNSATYRVGHRRLHSQT
jgi:hypothetical protein